MHNFRLIYTVFAYFYSISQFLDDFSQLFVTRLLLSPIMYHAHLVRTEK